MMLDLDPSRLPMTSEQFERLPDMEGVRFELVEGNLLVMSAAYLAWHGQMVLDLAEYFRRRGDQVLPERGIRIGPGTVRTCDLGVFARRLTDLRVAYHDASAFSIVVEVVSPESRTCDHIDKPREYASVGIPEYWLVDEDPASLMDGVVSVYRLTLTDDGPRYQLGRKVAVSQL